MATSPRTKLLKKELGLLGVYAMALGATLGTGFFPLPGLVAKLSGPALPLVFLIAAIPLVPALFSKVELATAMPRAGGVYYFLDRSMGPLVGTIGGLGSWLVLTLKTAFALMGMGAYVNLLFPELPVIPLALAFTLLFGFVNVVGAKGAGRFQAVLVGGLLIALLWFLGGVLHVDWSRFNRPFASGPDSLLAAAGLAYVGYIGLTKVASVSEEVRKPERNLPLGIFLAFVTALIIYLVGTTVMVGVMPMNELAGSLTPVASAAHRLGGGWGEILMIVAAVLAIASVANAGILSASRYPLAMSRDHILPPTFRHLDAKGNPRRSIYVTVGLMLAFLLMDPTSIAKLASAFQLLLFAIICLAVIVMRESRLDSYDPGFRSPFYPWMQIFGFFTSILLIVPMGWLSILFTVALLTAGTAWYFHYVKGRVARAGAIYHIFERLGHNRFEGLDAELRGILKEKGLRDQDPFDEVVARAHIVDLQDPVDFELVARRAATLLAERIPVGADHIFDGFLRGTRVGATPVSHGTALPHLRLPGIEAPQMVIVRAAKGVQIDVVDEFGEALEQDRPVEAVFFLVSSEDNPSQHLRILAQLAGRVDDEDFLDAWRQAEHEQELKEILLREERYLSLAIVPDAPSEQLAGLALRETAFPDGCLVAIVRRNELIFVPRGDTTLAVGDRLTVIGDPDGIARLRSKYGGAHA